MTVFNVLPFTDHDECSGDGHGCKQLCVNLRGGYKCDCDSGYRVNADDRKSCDGNLINIFPAIQSGFVNKL